MNRKGTNRGSLYSFKYQTELLLMVLPAFVCVLIFDYIPIYGVTFALRELNFTNVWMSEWADPLFKYFNFLNNPEFHNVFKNTIVIAVSKFVFGFPAPIVLALLLNELRTMWFKRTVQSISYLPHFISWVVIAGLAHTLLSTQIGPAASLLNHFGLQMPNLLGNASAFIPLMVGLSIWQSIGWGTIIYLAAIAGVDPALYEAAGVDGAHKLHQMWHITIPGIMPTISILLILSIPGVINAGFEQIYNFQNPMVMQVADIIDTYILRIGLERGSYSLATAVGLFKSILGMILILLANYMMKSRGGQGIW